MRLASFAGGVLLFVMYAGLCAAVASALVQHEPPETTPAGDATRGQALFERRCTGCHAIDADREGPHLRGVYGRKAGSVPGYDYSAALKRAGIVWTEENLDRWLTDSDEMVGGSAMGFAVGKPQERADLIAYLKRL